MIVRAALFGRSGSVEIVNAELAAPGVTEVLVRLVATGICHTDVKAARPGGLVPHPVVLGHEGAGIVADIGSAVTTLAIGDHVVMTFSSCGGCPSCVAAEPAYCHHSTRLNFGCGSPQRLSVDGTLVHGGFFGQSSFASHAIADIRNTVRVRRDAPLDLLGPLGCGVQTGAGAVLNVLRPTTGSKFVVFGAGSVGLSAVMAARLTAVDTIIAIDSNLGRLEMALELGATGAYQAGPETSADLRRVLGAGADCVLDTTGSPEVIHQGLNLLAPRGTFGYVTSPWDGKDVPLPVRHMLWGRRMVGIIQGSSQPHSFIPALVDLVMSGRLPLEKIICFYDFEDIGQALDDMAVGKVIKPVLKFA